MDTNFQKTKLILFFFFILFLFLMINGCNNDNDEKNINDDEDPKSQLTPADYTNSFGMTFNLIQPGTFIMGQIEEPKIGEIMYQEVTLTQPFYIQTTELTQKQWVAVMGEFTSWHPPHQSCSSCSSCPNCPVEEVVLTFLEYFLQTLNEQGEGTYSIPTEAQWEYAARAGSTTAFANGEMTGFDCDYDANLDSMGWYCFNSGGIAQEVALKKPNAWGLYDMHGNVREWVSDYFGGSYSATPVVDPTGPSGSNAKLGFRRIVRGGGYQDSVQACRSYDRNSSEPVPAFRVGVRLIRLP
jgi:formylglycine-generating enzyme required for sulfatase activity